MAARTGVAACILALLLVSPASCFASPVLERVKASGTIRCGAAPRPGLFEPEAGRAHGLLVDLCRAVGVAAAGPAVTVEMTADDSDKSYEAIRSGLQDLVFLSGAEIVDHGLAGAVLPGPTVYYETSALMVADDSPVRQPAELSGQPICLLQGEASSRHLEAWFAARHLAFVRMGYQEPVEMVDAFEARACHALAGEATGLAAVRRREGSDPRAGRILAEPLATFPIVAATGTDDAAWSAVVAWTIATLQDADRPKLDWVAGGLDSLPLGGPSALGPDWQKEVIAAGSYAALLDRNLGAASSLKIPPGPNALTTQGGLLAPLYAE